VALSKDVTHYGQWSGFPYYNLTTLHQEDSPYLPYGNLHQYLGNKRAINRLGIIPLAHVTDFSVVNVHVDELPSARIWQHKFCVTLSANVNINYCLPIKVYYRICTLRHIRIEIIHGSQNVFWVLTWVGGY
jgi:hypothetical protein